MRLTFTAAIVLAAAAGCAFHSNAHTFDGEFCADGACRAKVGGYGFYQPKWRKWPSAPAAVEPATLEDQLIPTPPIYMPDELTPSDELPTPERTSPAVKAERKALGDDGVFLPNDTEILSSPPEDEAERDVPELPQQLRSNHGSGKPLEEEPKLQEEPNPFDLQDALEPPEAQPKQHDTDAAKPEEAPSDAAGFELLPPAVERQKITLTRPDSAQVRRPRTIVQTSAIEPEMIKLSEHHESSLIGPPADRAAERVHLLQSSERAGNESLRLLPPQDLRADTRLFVPDASLDQPQASSEAELVASEELRDEPRASDNPMRIQTEIAPAKSEWRPVRGQRAADETSNRANPLRTK